MTEQEVKAFLDEIFQKVIPHGDLDRISEFYTEDVVGHQNNQEFYLEDIKERFKIVRKHFAAFSFKVENFLLLNDLIIFVVRQNWLETQEKEYYEAIITVVYRLRNKKVCELWVLADNPLETYQTMNTNFQLSWKLFNINEKSKKNFISRLLMSDYLKQQSSLKFSNIEIDCLYYYLNGFTAKETAKLLNLSHRTIETHIANLKSKLNCHSKHELRKKLFEHTSKTSN